MASSYSEYVNVSEALGRIGGNAKILVRLLDSFIKNKSYDELLAAIADNDIPAAAAAAHAVKGMAANLSMPALYKTSTDYEQKLKTGENDESLFADFKEAFEKTLGCLEDVKSDLA